jgi:hypothetical protein
VSLLFADHTVYEKHSRKYYNLVTEKNQVHVDFVRILMRMLHGRYSQNVTCLVRD